MSKLSIPEIRINFSWLLANDVSVKLSKLNGRELKPYKQYEDWTEAYRKAWLEKEKTILAAMQEITGLQFYLNTIDISTVPYIIAKSHPLIVNFRDGPEGTVATITHELCHTLFCDNTIISIYGKNRNFGLASEWKKLFGTFNEDFAALVHVPVLALCQKIFQDHLGDDTYVKRDRELMKRLNATSYIEAWDYVEKEGADRIIEKLRKSYASIAKKLEKKK